MALVSVVNGLGEAIYETMISVLLGIKVLIRGVCKPWRIQQDIEAELSRPVAERHEFVLSPPLFLCLFGIVPYLWLGSYLETAATSATREGGPLVRSLISLLGESFTRRFFMASGFFMIGPFISTLVIQKWFLKKRIGREALRPVFYGQAICFGCLYFAWFVLLGIWMAQLYRMPNKPTDLEIPIWLCRCFSVSMLWLLIAECCILLRGFRIGLWRFIDGVIPALVGVVLWVIGMVSYLHVLFGSQKP